MGLIGNLASQITEQPTNDREEPFLAMLQGFGTHLAKAQVRELYGGQWNDSRHEAKNESIYLY